jgi:hypothetical protein
MQPVIPLPGFERLLKVCRTRRHPHKVEPPLPPELRAGFSVGGLPMDPQLAAVHERVGYLWVREEIAVLPLMHELRPDVLRLNADWRREWAEPFGSLCVFARDDRLTYCYATVPALADETGTQPVVWVDIYEKLYAVPVGSDVDHFFDTYARYMESAPPFPEGADFAPRTTTFPWNASEFVARDRRLVTMLRAGRFDFLLKNNTQARKWVEAVVAARR